MNGFHKLQRDYKIGDRIVSGSGYYIDYVSKKTKSAKNTTEYRDIRVETVEWIDQAAVECGHNVRMKVRHGDETREIVVSHTSVSSLDKKWKVLWVDPLPADDDAAIEIVRRAARYGHHNRITFLWFPLGATADTYTYAHMLTEFESYSENYYMGSVSGPNGAKNLLMSTMAMPIKPCINIDKNSLIVAVLDDAYYENGLIIHNIADEHVLKTGVTLLEACSYIPDKPKYNNQYKSCNYASNYEIARNEELAIARSEPSEALVLSWMDGDSLQTKCLTTSGISFWCQDDPEIYAENGVPGIGLWLWKNVKIHAYTSYEGEYDMDMEGDWEVPTIEQVEEIGGSILGIGMDIVEYTGEDHPETIVQTYLDMAHKSAKEEA